MTRTREVSRVRRSLMEIFYFVSNLEFHIRILQILSAQKVEPKTTRSRVDPISNKNVAKARGPFLLSAMTNYKLESRSCLFWGHHYSFLSDLGLLINPMGVHVLVKALRAKYF